MNAVSIAALNITALALLASCLQSAEPKQDDVLLVENLATYAKVQGYVRYFSPRERVTTLDWDSFNLIGVQEAAQATDRAELRASLIRLFQPIAPELLISELSAADHGSPNETLQQKPGPGGLIFWQHNGIRLSEQPGPYEQRRVILGPDNLYKNPLFLPAHVPLPLRQAIGSGLELQMPLALPVDAEGNESPVASDNLTDLQSKLAQLNPKAIALTDWRMRVTDVITVWCIFQHFHPYLNAIGVDWEDALRPALLRALHDQNADDLYWTLSEMIAKSHDGHGFVNPYALHDLHILNAGGGGVPIRVAEIEQQLVVTGAAENAPFRKGDIIVRLDGIEAMPYLGQRERYVSGSPQLRRYRALNEFGAGPIGSTAKFDLLRDGLPVHVEFIRTKEHRGFFFNNIGEFTFPAVVEIKPGIFYVNLYACDAPTLSGKLPLLENAKGIIFDWRFDGQLPADPKREPINPHKDIIPHLIEQRINASPMLVPQITEPDRRGWSYSEATWPVEPAAPRFRGRVVFINEPSVVSYGETCMAMIADYHLATLVGESTAGCNGNANFISLPGGFRVMWTGMDVRKHDHSRFYDIGFPPNSTKARTLDAVKQGQDEFLAQAIQLIEESTPAK